MSYRDNIGRVGQLCDLVSKPEMNGLYVVLETYNAEKVRYGIKTLAPHSGVESVSILVKLSNIQFCCPETFASMFPSAAAQRGSSLANAYSDGTILDFSNVQWNPLKMETGSHRFDDSCHIVGARGTVGWCEGQYPATKFPEQLILSPAGPQTYMEVSNIDFTNGNVHCVFGEHTTFRNCRFGGQVGFTAGCEVTTAEVVLETCLFDGNSSIGTFITMGSKVTFFNCTFRRCWLAVRMAEGASASLTHCTFVDCNEGVMMPSKVSSLEVVNCSFTRGKVALGVQNGGEVSVRGSHIQNYNGGTSILVEGPKRTVLHIEDCVITECRMGVSACLGKVELTIRNTVITKHLFCGVLLMDSLLGSVTMSNCTIRDNELMDVMNYCGPSCPITINGKLQRSDDQIARSARMEPLRQKMLSWEKGVTENIESIRFSLKRLRTQKRTGMGYVECSNCRLHEGMEEKFKACAKCENVAYCCRECQVAHWKEHKKECGKVRYV